MIFKWEVCCAGTVRAKVFGGWIVNSSESSSETGDEITSSSVFIPDPNHEWTLEEE